MSTNLRVCVPEETTNYILNPSPRYATTGWSAVGSTVTRSLSNSRWSIASLQVVTNGSAINEGLFYRVLDLLGIQDAVTVSAYVRGNGKVHIRLINNPNGAQWYSDPVALTPARWTRIEVTGRCSGSNDMRLYVETADTTAKAITFYVDGAQMERKPYSTTYCDGAQGGCRWNILEYASQSSRDAFTRAGGRWVALAGPCRPNNDIYVTVLGGFGMPPIQNQTQPWSNSPGSFFQNQKVRDRVLTMSFFVKDADLRSSVPDLSALHEMRQQLIDIIKPDKTTGGEAFLFEYESTEADRKMYIRAHYDAGLDGSWDIRNRWVNAFPIRLLCVDPFWFEDSQDVATLGIKTTYNSATDMNFWGYINREWKKIETAAGVTIKGSVECGVIAPDGTVYLGGDFKSASAGALSMVAKWDGKNFTAVGNNVDNGTVFGIDIGPDGTIYVVGSFTVIGGVACNNIAKYNPTTGVWSAMGTGLNSFGFAVCAAKNGQIYVGGSFSSAGGVTCANITRWDGSQFRTVGQYSGLSGTVAVIVRGIDGTTLYVGGTFATSNGGVVTYNSVCSLNTTTNLLSQMGYGFALVSNCVVALTVGLDGTVYAGGSFVTSGAPSAAPLLRVAKWTGGKIWVPMGSGFNDVVNSLAVGRNGTIYAGGLFTLSGTKNMFKIASWRNDVWTSLELAPAAVQQVDTILPLSNGDIYIGFSGIAAPLSFSVPKLTTISNSGTAAVFPLLYYKNAGTIRYIGNNKTGQAIYLDLTVFNNEEIFFDFARGKITSPIRGDLSFAIMPGSEIRSIYCLPGDNVFSVFVTNDVGGIMQLRLTPQHWSADAVMDVEEVLE